MPCWTNRKAAYPTFEYLSPPKKNDLSPHRMSTRETTLMSALQSTVGKKILTGITGLSLVLFVIMHMAGNLSYFAGPGAYNKYADKLLNLGPLLIVVELGLLAVFLLHAYLGINIYLGKRRARRQGYSTYRTQGGASKQSLSSRSMIITGIVLLIFTVIHLKTFKFGPGIEDGYFADTHGEAIQEAIDFGPDQTAVVGDEVVIRDLKRLVTEKFQHWYYAFGYIAVMILLGLHLRHGVWSAFQSLGAMNPRLTPVVYALGGVLAVLIAVGFLVLPLYIFFGA